MNLEIENRKSKIENLNVVVIGLGITGAATARFLKNRGARVTVTDTASEEKLQPRAAQMREMEIDLELGPLRAELIGKADLVVVSPGVPHALPLLSAAREKGIPVLGEIELACRFVSEPIVAVTGTNGKTTTTALLGEMLRCSGLSVFVGGNIGNPLIGYVDRAEKAQAVVLEISSFQLDTMETFRPHVAVLLNITEDHLDRYPDFAAYARSKLRIFENQEASHTAILNGSDPVIRKMGGHLQARRLYFSGRRHGEPGADIEKDRIVFHLCGPSGEGEAEIPLSRIRLPGRHNVENVSAAALAALSSGGTMAGIDAALSTFRGLAHRLETVATVDGVDYVNDSKATTVDSVIKALESFSRPILLILGGRNKGSDFRILREPVRTRVKEAFVMGEAAGEILDALAGAVCARRVGSMEEAVASAHHAASPGDVVLLSPACASFDMFLDYPDRGRAFRRAVERISNKGP